MPDSEPQALLQLVRERVSASVVLQRGRIVEGKRGLKVIGRRSPAGGPIRWMFEYDDGLDPDDPGLRAQCPACRPSTALGENDQAHAERQAVRSKALASPPGM